MRGPLLSVGGSVGTGVSGPRRWGRGPGFAVGRWSGFGPAQVSTCEVGSRPVPGGGSRLSLEKARTQRVAGGGPPPPLFLWPARSHSLVLAWWGALFRSMGYYGAHVRALIWGLSFAKFFFSIFFPENASQIGLRISEEIAPLPYQRQRSPKRASGSKRAIKLGVQGACPRPSFSPFLGRNGDPRRAGGPPRGAAPRGTGKAPTTQRVRSTAPLPRPGPGGNPRRRAHPAAVPMEPPHPAPVSAFSTAF